MLWNLRTAGSSARPLLSLVALHAAHLLHALAWSQGCTRLGAIVLSEKKNSHPMLHRRGRGRTSPFFRTLSASQESREAGQRLPPYDGVQFLGYARKSNNVLSRTNDRNHCVHWCLILIALFEELS